MENYLLQLIAIIVIALTIQSTSIVFAKVRDEYSYYPESLQPYIVPPKIKGNIISFSGFLNGSAGKEAQMFFWHFPAESSTNRTDPLIVWLQGDIGTSSVRGIFENNGPFYAKTKGLHLRKEYWSQKFNMLYLDTTPGAGYSHANSDWSYPKSMNELIDNLLASLESFFQLFDYLRKSDLYLAGDGFACTTVSALGEKISSKKPQIKLKGFILENGFCDATKATSIANHLFNLKMIDSIKSDYMIKTERQIQRLLQGNSFDSAFTLFDSYILGLLTPYKTSFSNNTHYESSNNLLYPNKTPYRGNYSAYVMKRDIKSYLNVPREIAYNDGKIVLSHLKGELMKNSLPTLSELANKYKILMYYGQTNPEISPNTAYKIASSLKWCGGEYFEDVEYEPWFIENTIVGYLKNVWTGECLGSLVWSLIRNAGKDIAGEKPAEVLDLITKFINDTLPGVVKNT